MIPFMGSALITAVADIGVELNMGVTAAGGIVSTYVLTTAVLLLPVSRLADSLGYLRTLFLGSVTYVVTMILCTMVNSSEMLLTMRVLEGAAGAFIACSGMTLLSLYFPPEDRGKAMGINTFMIYTGLSLGPVIGGFLNSRFGWRSIFWFGTALSTAVLVFFITRRMPFEKFKRVKIDVNGNILYIAATTLFFAGFSMNSRIGFTMAAAGVVCYAVFFFYERGRENPLLDTELFTHNAVFALSNLSSLLNYMSASAVLFLVSLELRLSFGYDTSHIGLVLLAQSLAMTITAPLAGRYSDRHPTSLISAYGMGLISLMLLMMAFAAGWDNVYFIVPIQFFIGIGFGMFAPANNKVIMNSVEKKYYSTASSVLASMRLFGQTLSIALSVLVISVFAGNIKVEHLKPEELTHGLKAVYLVFAAISFIGAVTSAYGRGKRLKSH